MKSAPPPVDAVKFCDFVTASPTPFHAVANLSTRLVSAGFTPISERTVDTKSLTPGGKYFYTRNQSSIVAFTLPAKSSPQTAISFAVGHVDSPCLKVRPVSKRVKEGYMQVGVELYGGGIWASWFDRDLSLAGRVIVSTPSSDGPSYTSRLVKIDRPILRIPTLAIHLDRTINEAFKFNKETEFRPVLGLVADRLNDTGDGAGSAKTGASTTGVSGESAQNVGKEDVTGMAEKHHPMMLALLADELGCAIGDIQDFELSLYDTQASCVGGLSNEFIFSPRLDNLMSSFASIEGLCAAAEAEQTSDSASSETNVRCVILFDNEEVGSVSHHGAESDLLPSFVERLVSLPDFSHAGYHQTLANSFLVSVDMGHAINPNYADKHESNHAPRMNGGVVIKTNANQRYTSNAQTTFLVRRVAKKAGVPVQEFEIRNDSVRILFSTSEEAIDEFSAAKTCGSTVGPHLSTHVRTVDVGLAQLSMHSIRETCGSADVKSYIRFFQAYFDGFAAIDQDLKVD